MQVLPEQPPGEEASFIFVYRKFLPQPVGRRLAASLCRISIRCVQCRNKACEGQCESRARDARARTGPGLASLEECRRICRPALRLRNHRVRQRKERLSVLSRRRTSVALAIRRSSPCVGKQRRSAGGISPRARRNRRADSAIRRRGKRLELQAAQHIVERGPELRELRHRGHKDQVNHRAVLLRQRHQPIALFLRLTIASRKW